MKKIIVALMAVLMCVAFAACAPANVEKAQAKMEKAEYKVVVNEEQTVIDALYGEEAVATVSASKGGLTNMKTVSAILFESSKAAKEYYNDVKEDAGEDVTVKKSGKWVVMGDEDAVKAFLK